ncbi:uncharacterized protein AMSG_00810 [Thecamonas trahens ATCC 50062]|uniref:Mediator of RNA polymerase II transcription subunit 7 n=1 Tax=Thecamonas trahens ATCC 50062 TaxID=461836 RepID=A0A0L0DE99_THETB|nr:hypothetical protein AMSG_00810 [Thecamonas trahens ATCC 50062]KNC50647.1 hypothetical protein AMSG_00810 [Thecamonas trahens ATCC 50062]|eukprot:XP_013762532.1 hypothetical protein AMSG_00810 [Thecamonas trahens ATCC 50062]
MFGESVTAGPVPSTVLARDALVVDGVSTASPAPSAVPALLTSLLDAVVRSYLALLHTLTHSPDAADGAIVSLRSMLYNMTVLTSSLRANEARLGIKKALEADVARKRALLADFASLRPHIQNLLATARSAMVAKATSLANQVDELVAAAPSLADVAETGAPLPSPTGVLTGYAPPSNVTLVGIYPLTGSLAGPGAHVHTGVLLAIEDINRNPNLLPKVCPAPC